MSSGAAQPAATGIPSVHDWLDSQEVLEWHTAASSAPLLPVVLALECLWTALPRWGFWATAPILLSHGYSAGFFLAALLQKKLIVGKLAPRSGGAAVGLALGPLGRVLVRGCSGGPPILCQVFGARSDWMDEVWRQAW